MHTYLWLKIGGQSVVGFSTLTSGKCGSAHLVLRQDSHIRKHTTQSVSQYL